MVDQYKTKSCVRNLSVPLGFPHSFPSPIKEASCYFLCLARMDQIRTQIHLAKNTMTYEDILIKKLIPEANAVAALAPSLRFQLHCGPHQIEDKMFLKHLRLIQLAHKSK